MAPEVNPPNAWHISVLERLDVIGTDARTLARILTALQYTRFDDIKLAAELIDVGMCARAPVYGNELPQDTRSSFIPGETMMTAYGYQNVLDHYPLILRRFFNQGTENETSISIGVGPYIELHPPRRSPRLRIEWVKMVSVPVHVEDETFGTDRPTVLEPVHQMWDSAPVKALFHVLELDFEAAKKQALVLHEMRLGRIHLLPHEEIIFVVLLRSSDTNALVATARQRV